MRRSCLTPAPRSACPDPEVVARFNVHLSSRLHREHAEMYRLLEGLVSSERRAEVEGIVPAELSGQLAAMLRLMKAHLRAEEEVVLPMLEARLDEAQAYSLYERMEEALFDAAVTAFTQQHPLAG